MVVVLIYSENVWILLEWSISLSQILMFVAMVRKLWVERISPVVVNAVEECTSLKFTELFLIGSDLTVGFNIWPQNKFQISCCK